MIKINLLPHDLRPITRTPVPHIASLVVLAVALLFMGQQYMALIAEVKSVEADIAQEDAALAMLDATVQEHGELEQQKVQLQKMVETIQTILKDRTIWSEHLHHLASLTPDNVWYKRVRVLSRRFSEEQPETDRRGVTTMKRISVERQVFEVSGYAIDDETGLSSTATLATNTAVDPAFSETFQLFQSRIVDTEFDGFQVREFIFEYLVS